MEAVANGMTTMSVAYQDLVRGVTVLALLGADRVVVEASGGTLRLLARHHDTGGASAVVELGGVAHGDLPAVEVPLRALAADVGESEPCSFGLTHSALVVHADGCDYRVPAPARMANSPDPLVSHQQDPFPAGSLLGCASEPLARVLFSVAFENDPLDVVVLDPRGVAGARGARRFALAPLEGHRLVERVAVPGRLVRAASAFRPDRIRVVLDRHPRAQLSYVRLLASEGANLCVLEAPAGVVPAPSLLRFLEPVEGEVPIITTRDAESFHNGLVRFSEFSEVEVGNGPDDLSSMIATDENGEQLSACFPGTVSRRFQVSPMDLRFLLTALHGAVTVSSLREAPYPLLVRATDGTVRGVLRGP